MKTKYVLPIILIFLVGIVGFVSAIQCTDADYDSDGDVDSLDLIKFRDCYNKEFTTDCEFWDFNSDSKVDDIDLSSFQEVYLMVCISCADAD